MKRTSPVFLSLLILCFNLFLPASVFATDDEAELGPGVASHVNQEDAPLDHAATKNAAQESVRMTGVGDPLKKTEPIGDHWFQSGKFPEDTYTFTVGSDKKVYGKGQNPPKGPRKRLDIRIKYAGGESWVAYAEIIHTEGNLAVTDGLAGNLISEKSYLESDQGKGFDSQLRNEARMKQFFAPDPATAARVAVAKLQMKGLLYDPTVPVESPVFLIPPATPGVKKEEPRLEEKKPERQAHPVHGSGRQAQPLHGSQTQATAFAQADSVNNGGSFPAMMGRDMQSGLDDKKADFDKK